MANALTQMNDVAGRAESAELSITAKITTHLVLEEFDGEKAGLEILHRDLFDSDPEVAVSAIECLGRIGDARSLAFVAKSLASQNQAIRMAAVCALGRMGKPSAVKPLMELFHTTRDESLRTEVLGAVLRLDPKHGEAMRLLEELSGSLLITAQGRSAAVSLMLQHKADVDVAALLGTAGDNSFEAVLGFAVDHRAAVGPLVEFLSPRFVRLPDEAKERLVSVLPPFESEGALTLWTYALADGSEEIRRAAYRSVSHDSVTPETLAVIFREIASCVDNVPSVEDEALAAIERLGSTLPDGFPAPPSLRNLVYTSIEELIGALKSTGRKIGGDSHELGWLISRSREYVEYYVGEDFRRRLISFLKAGNLAAQDDLLRELKASALRVEVRHFDGYTALNDIISNPKRAGVALIARELALAKLGKKQLLSRLIRNLRLTRIVPTTGTGFDSRKEFLAIFEWSRDQRLYRLAEAALFALSGVDRETAVGICIECLQMPIGSKILAIAALHLLKAGDWGQMEPVVLKLIESCRDHHVMLNLVDALLSQELPNSEAVALALLRRIGWDDNAEIARKTADYLSSRAGDGLVEGVIAAYEKADRTRRDLLIEILRRRVVERGVSNTERLSEFLYSILRDNSSRHKLYAAALLWRLEDEYSLKVLRQLAADGGCKGQCDALRDLGGAVEPKIVPFMTRLLLEHGDELQQNLRAALLSTTSEESRKLLCSTIIALRSGGLPDATGVNEDDAVPANVDFRNERRAYQFEQECLQELTVLFTDIQGYTKKAQSLSSMQLSSLIWDYEGTLIPTIQSHQGELIKRMGDGHLFVFQKPLNATLAAVRLQKALKRFNSYREEELRVLVRVGIHVGKVVRRGQDVLGNDVNIASRLESSAPAGSVLVSAPVFEQVKEHVHARAIGDISVKGIEEPIRVYEPYEIALDLPPDLDPARREPKAPTKGSASNRPKPPAPLNGTTPDKAPVATAAREPRDRLLDRELVRMIVDTFSSLDALCRRAEKNEAQVADIRAELITRWRLIRDAIKTR